MALTHGADAKSISKKVKRMLRDLNLEEASRTQVRLRPASRRRWPPTCAWAASARLSCLPLSSRCACDHPRPSSGCAATQPRAPAARTLQDDGASGGGLPNEEADKLLSAFARDSGGRSISVMSSLRGLGAGISKFFSAASVLGSRAPSMTPPPSEMMTLATNSVVNSTPAGGAAGRGGILGASTGGGAAGAVAACSGASGGGAGSSDALVPASPAGNVLGGSSAMAAPCSAPGIALPRARMLRGAVPPPLAVPPMQDMGTISGVLQRGGGPGGSGTDAVANTPAGGVSTGSTPLPLMPVPPAGLPHTPQHHYRVAHMRTITEENLDLLLRPGSSGGADLLASSGHVTPTGGDAAGGAAANAQERGGSPVRRRVGLLGSTAEGPDGGESTDEGSGGPAAVGESKEPEGGSPAGAAPSPFGDCGTLASRSTHTGVAAERSAVSTESSATSSRPLRTSDGSAAAAGGAGAAGACQLAQRASSGGRSMTPSQVSAWAGVLSPAAAGPVGGAGVGAGDRVPVATRYPGGAANEELRLAMATPPRMSSAAASERGAGGAPGAGGGASMGGCDGGCDAEVWASEGGLAPGEERGCGLSPPAEGAIGPRRCVRC